MNKKIIFHIALLGIFSNLGAMNQKNDSRVLFEMYQCKIQKGKQPEENGTLTIGLSQDLYDQQPPLPAIKSFEYDDIQNVVTINLDDTTKEHVIAKISEAALARLMKEIAENPKIVIAFQNWHAPKKIRFIGSPHDAAKAAAATYYTKRLSDSLAATNKNLHSITVEKESGTPITNALQGSWISRSLRVGGFSDFTIDGASAEHLLKILKLVPKDTSYISIITTPTSGKIVLNVNYAKQQIQSQFTYIKRMKYSFVSTCIAALALLAYLKLWSK